MSDTARIEGGIEWLSDDDDAAVDPRTAQCARCGSSVEFAQCGRCGGQGFTDDDGDEWDDDDELEPCPDCDGTCGSWHCVSSPDWCKANPLPGREHIESTALSAEAWSDCL